MTDVKHKIITWLSITLIIIGIIYYGVNSIQMHSLNVSRIPKINTLLLETISLLQVKKPNYDSIDNKIKEFKEETADIVIATDQTKTHINKWTLVLITEENDLCDMIYTDNKARSINNDLIWTDMQIIDECDKLNKLTYLILNNH